MRREPYGEGSILHIVKRGARGLPFLKDKADFHRTLLMLAHFNDTVSRANWFRDVLEEDAVQSFKRPSSWPEKKPLVSVHAFCLHTNHIHLLLEETKDGGVSAFMQKLGNGIAGYVNEKYGEFGSPFQGSYRSKTIDSDAYLRYVIAYIQTKNTFERFPGGYAAAEKNFSRALEWSKSFPFSSSFDHLRRSDLHNERGIVSRELIPRLWKRGEYERYARDVIAGRARLTESEMQAVRGAFA